jgi:hypothetical protein
MSHQIAIGSVLVLAAVVACGESSTESPAGGGQALLGGEISGPEDDAVIDLKSIMASGTIWSCTGTLVAPNVVVTARHCVSNFVPGLYTCDANGERVSGDGGDMGALVVASDISVRAGTQPSSSVVAKGASIYAPQAPTICRNDIAVIVLDREVTSLPIMPLRLYEGTEPGEQARVVGYGFYSDAKDSPRMRHTRSGLTITKVGSTQFRPNGDAIPPRTFMTSGPVLCDGDSGGPALTEKNAVVGVFSQFVGLECTDSSATSYFTEVAPFLNDVVLPAFTAAGAEPWLEGSPRPGLAGAAGSGGNGGVPATAGNSAIAGESATAGTSPNGGSPAIAGDSATAGNTTTAGTSSAAGNPATAGDSASAGTSGAADTTSNGGTPATAGESTGGNASIGGMESSRGVSGGDTSTEILYVRGPPKGGSCACRATGTERGGFGSLVVAASALLSVTRRRRASRSCA